jgi:hypothetical protein
MKLEAIERILGEHSSLIDLCETVYMKLCEYDSDTYKLRRGIQSIDIDIDYVGISVDDTSMGCYDSESFAFPTKWLSFSDAELKSHILKIKEDREDKKRKDAELLKHQRDVQKRENDMKEYERLKKQFG